MMPAIAQRGNLPPLGHPALCDIKQRLCDVGFEVHYSMRMGVPWLRLLSVLTGRAADKSGYALSGLLVASLICTVKPLLTRSPTRSFITTTNG
jgi:hypothetical protein